MKHKNTLRDKHKPNASLFYAILVIIHDRYDENLPLKVGDNIPHDITFTGLTPRKELVKWFHGLADMYSTYMLRIYRKTEGGYYWEDYGMGNNLAKMALPRLVDKYLKMVGIHLGNAIKTDRDTSPLLTTERLSFSSSPRDWPPLSSLNSRDDSLAHPTQGNFPSQQGTETAVREKIEPPSLMSIKQLPVLEDLVLDSRSDGTNQKQSSAATVPMVALRASYKASRVRAPMLRRTVLILEKSSSIGDKSGE